MDLTSFRDTQTEGVMKTACDFGGKSIMAKKMSLNYLISKLFGTNNRKKKKMLYIGADNRSTPSLISFLLSASLWSVTLDKQVSFINL